MGGGSILLPFLDMGAGSSRYLAGSILLPCLSRELKAPESSGSILLPFLDMGAGSSRYFHAALPLAHPFLIMPGGIAMMI